MECKYKGCNEPPLGLSEFCWDHLQDKDGYSRKLTEALNDKKDLSGCNLKKAVLRKVHLEKVNLSKVNLSQADISGSHLFDVNLDSADLIGTNLSDCYLTHCNFKGADLTKATLAHARLWNADLSGANLTECDLSYADLWDAKLFNVKIWRAILVCARGLCKKSFSEGSRMFDNPRINESGAISAEESYRNLKQCFLSSGKYNDASWASFKEKTMERAVFKTKRDLNYFPSLLMNLLCGYGEKPSRIVLSSISTIFLFALIYFTFNAVQSSVGQENVLKWSDYLYYSAVTFTTVGYGDLIPKPYAFFRLLAATEAFLGVFLAGLFIFTLARKYSAR